jgi:hypothetical protein
MHKIVTAVMHYQVPTEQTNPSVCNSHEVDRHFRHCINHNVNKSLRREQSNTTIWSFYACLGIVWKPPYTEVSKSIEKSCIKALDVGIMPAVQCICIPSGTESSVLYQIKLGVWSSAEAKDSSSSLCPDRVWGPPNLLTNGYRWSFSRG